MSFQDFKDAYYISNKDILDQVKPSLRNEIILEAYMKNHNKQDVKITIMKIKKRYNNNKEYRDANKQQLQQKQKEYRNVNIEEINTKKKIFREANKKHKKEK